MNRLFVLIFTSSIAFFKLNAQVTNTSYVSQYGEKVLQLSVIVPMDKKDVWKLFTTDEGLKKWIAPVAKIVMKTGGIITTNYDKNKKLEDSSSIQLEIINYLDYEMMTLKVELNDNFPADIQTSDQNLQEIIQFFDAGNGKTKLVSSMIGWGQGDHWDKAYSFFEKGNTWTYKEILKLF